LRNGDHVYRSFVIQFCVCVSLYIIALLVGNLSHVISYASACRTFRSHKTSVRAAFNLRNSFTSNSQEPTYVYSKLLSAYSLIAWFMIGRTKAKKKLSKRKRKFIAFVKILKTLC